MLAKRKWSVYSHVMGTDELLRQVKALSPPEQLKIFRAILALEESESRRRPTKSKRVEWSDVESRAKHIFGKRVAPNMVLSERDEKGVLK